MSQAESQVSQLRAVAPAAAVSEQITVTSRQRREDGVTVENKVDLIVAPFAFRTWFKVIAHAERILAAVGEVEADLNDPIGLTHFVMHTMAKAGDDLQAIVALAIDRPVEFFDTLGADDGLAVTIKTFEVNKDFLSQKVYPMLETVLPQIKAAVASEQQTD